MKRYIFSLLAIAIAVGSWAFTKAEKKATQYVFEYAGANTPGEVQKLENWHYLGMDLEPCSGDNYKACRIFVSEADVDDPVNPTSLENSVIITEGVSSTGVYVSTISGSGPASRSNKAN